MNELKVRFDLDVYGIADDTAYVKIGKSENGIFIKFCPSNLESPDFVLYGKELEEFAINILKMIESDKGKEKDE